MSGELDEINRGILELLYTKSSEEPDKRWIKRASLSRALDVDDEVLEKCINQLIYNGLVEEDHGKRTIRLSGEGIRAIEANITSYCPHL